MCERTNVVSVVSLRSANKSICAALLAVGLSVGAHATTPLGDYGDTPLTLANKAPYANQFAYNANSGLAAVSVGEQLSFTTPDGQVVQFSVIRAVQTAAGNRFVAGNNTDGDSLMLVLTPSGKLRGHVKVGDNTFIMSLLDRGSLMTAVATQHLPGASDDGAAISRLDVEQTASRRSGQELSERGPSPSSAASNTITIGIAYDTLFATAHPNPQPEIDYLVQYTNTAFQTSGIDAELVVGSSMAYDHGVAYSRGGVDFGPVTSMLNTITCGTPNSCDIFTQAPQGNATIAQWRTDNGLDMVVQLALDASNSCKGLAWQPGFNGLSDFQPENLKKQTYSVVAVNDPQGGIPSFCGSTFAHELGHNFGLAHDRATSPNATTAYPYARGYVTSAGRGSIMSYAQNTLDRFSDPNFLDNGVPFGDVNDAHAARAISDVIANYPPIYQGGGTTPTPTPNPPPTPTGASIKIDQISISLFTGVAGNEFDVQVLATFANTAGVTADAYQLMCDNGAATSPVSFAVADGTVGVSNLNALKDDTSYQCEFQLSAAGAQVAKSDPVWIYSGLASGKTLRESLIGQAHLIYVGILGRGADRPGFEYWYNELSSGRIDINGMRSNFVQFQPEWLNGLGNLNRGELVNALYRNLFNRQPDAAGFDYWALGDGSVVPADVLVLALIDGAQGPDLAALENRATVAAYYSNFYSGTGSDANAAAAIAGVTSDPATVTQGQGIVDGYR